MSPEPDRRILPGVSWIGIDCEELPLPPHVLLPKGQFTAIRGEFEPPGDQDLTPGLDYLLRAMTGRLQIARQALFDRDFLVVTQALRISTDLLTGKTEIL